jgi:hypothetical protein
MPDIINQDTTLNADSSEFPLSSTQLKHAAKNLDCEISEPCRQQLFAKLKNQQMNSPTPSAVNSNIVKVNFFTIKKMAFAASIVVTIAALQFLVVNQNINENLTIENIASIASTDNQVNKETSTQTDLLNLLLNNQQIEHQLTKDKISTHQLDHEYNAILADLDKIKGKIARL